MILPPNQIQELTNKPFLSPKEVELLYGFKLNTQAKWRMQKIIPYRKIGRFIRYEHQELKEWMNRHRV